MTRLKILYSFHSHLDRTKADENFIECRHVLYSWSTEEKFLLAAIEKYLKNCPPAGGLPFCLSHQILFFCELKPYAKFQNPMITPFVRKQAGAQLCQAQAQLGLHAETTTNHNLH